jgi:maltose alpha-D-glucosyltransferase/alpha-amylase
MKRLPKRLVKNGVSALKKQRWFQNKEANIKNILPFDYIRLTDEYTLGIFEVAFDGIEPEFYLIPTKKGGFQLDVVAEKTFLKALFSVINTGNKIMTEKGYAVFEKFGDWNIANNGGQFSVLDVGSSNTLISYAENSPLYILKMLRRVLAGRNVEAEAGRFLYKNTSFKNLPNIRASLAYFNNSGSEYHLATAFDFVQNEGSGWAWTLGELEWMIDQFIRDKTAPTEENVGFGMSYYNNMMYRLGKVLADLHVALSSGGDGSGFEMIKVTGEDTFRWREDLLAQAGKTFSLLEKFSGDLSDLIIVLSKKDEIMALFDKSPDIFSMLGYKIRQHADFHLGQVLVSNDDFFIIDFEGEPLKPYDQRAAHYPSLKDVAGMCRSFNYASFAAYLAYRDNNDIKDAATLELVQGVCRNWEIMARRSFLDGYFQQLTVDKAKFVTVTNRKILRKILSLLELEKALYEVEYEINNRPDWLPIPIGGILNCLKVL